MVRLVPMSESDFEMYLERAVRNYADDHVRAGNWHPSEALARSEQQFRQLLPDGVASKDQHVYSIEDTATQAIVGMIWFAASAQQSRLSAFIYDFEIREEYRRRGFASQAMQALEEKVRALGLEAISLHVFAHNHAARALYEKMGYVVTAIHMSKPLSFQSVEVSNWP